MVFPVRVQRRVFVFGRLEPVAAFVAHQPQAQTIEKIGQTVQGQSGFFANDAGHLRVRDAQVLHKVHGEIVATALAPSQYLGLLWKCIAFAIIGVMDRTHLKELRYQNLLKLLREARLRGMSVRDMAAKWNVHEAQVSQWKTRRRGIGEQTARHIEKASNLQPYSLDREDFEIENYN